MANPTVYETGSAVNVNNLLQKLETFAIAQGWLVDKSVLAEPYLDTDLTVDYSTQTGEILAGSTPWYSNRADGTFTVADSVITFTQDSGDNYHVILPLPGTAGMNIEIEWEISVHLGGTLQTMWGDGTNRENSTAIQTHRRSYTMGVGEYIRFESDDFRGSFEVTRITQRAPSITLSVHKDNVGYFHLKTVFDTNTDYTEDPGPHIYLSASNSYVEGSDYDQHPGASYAIARMNKLDEYDNGGNFHAYHFFSSAKHIYMIIEPIEGEFSHMGFGISRKYFDFRGGQFIYGTWWKHNEYQNSIDTSHHSLPMGFHHYYWNFNNYRADLIGTPTDRWLNESINTSSYPNSARLVGTYNGYTNQQYGENPYYGTSPLAPVYLAGYDHNDYLYALGEMEEYRKIFCKYIDPKTVLAINGEQWMVFPIKRKQLTTPDEYVSNSSNYALAYYIGDVPE